jgi:hypothetical protein
LRLDARGERFLKGKKGDNGGPKSDSYTCVHTVKCMKDLTDHSNIFQDVDARECPANSTEYLPTCFYDGPPCAIEQCVIDDDRCSADGTLDLTLSKSLLSQQTCASDAECDDEIFCNGAEICSDGYCKAGSKPCPKSQSCSEAGGGFCSSECRSITIEITTDGYPEDISWNITGPNSTIVASRRQGHYHHIETLYEEGPFCLSEGDNTFIIEDAYSDGICCGHGKGKYIVRDQNGDKLQEGGEYTVSESTTITVADLATQAPAPVEAPTPSCSSADCTSSDCQDKDSCQTAGCSWSKRDKSCSPYR